MNTLKILVHDAVDSAQQHHNPWLPDLQPLGVALPSQRRVQQWRRRALAQLELLMSELDRSLLNGAELIDAMQDTSEQLMSWVRRSLAALATPEGTEIVRGEPRRRFVAACLRELNFAEANAHDAHRRHEARLRAFLATALELTERGYAGLLAVGV